MRNATKNWWLQAVQDRLIALVLAMVVLVPLVATPADKSLRGISSLTLACFSLVLLVTLILRARWEFRQERVIAFLKTGANAPVLLFLGLALVSWAMSPIKAFGAQELLRIGTGILLYFVVGYQFRRSEHLSRLSDTILFLSISMSLIGFLQFSIGDQSRAIGPFSDHQLFGSFLMILLPIVAAIALTEKNPKRQIFAQIATVITGAALLLAHSRSAWIGALAGLCFLAAITILPLLRGGKIGANKHHAVLPLMLVASVVVFMALWPQSQDIMNRMGTLKNVSTDVSFNGRLETSRGAMTMMQRRPLTGFGVGTYSYYQKDFTGVGASLRQIPVHPSLMDQAHNFYLQTGAELGWPGLLAMIAVPVAFLITGVRRVLMMDEGLRRTLLLGSLGAVVAFAIDALGSPSWQFGQVSMLLWLSLGLGMSCMMRPQTKTREETQLPTRRFVTPRWVPLTASLLAAVCWTAMAGTIAAPMLTGTSPNISSRLGLTASPGSTPLDVYVVPVSATIEPKNDKIRGGTSLQYTLLVRFSDRSVQDVSALTATTFNSIGGEGRMLGTNNRNYQSRVRESDTPVISGTYTQSGVTVQADTPLTVYYP